MSPYAKKMQMASKNGSPNNRRQVEHIKRKTSLVHQGSEYEYYRKTKSNAL